MAHRALSIASGPPSGMPGGSKSEPETLNEADGMFVSGRRKGSAATVKTCGMQTIPGSSRNTK